MICTATRLKGPVLAVALVAMSGGRAAAQDAGPRPIEEVELAEPSPPTPPLPGPGEGEPEGIPLALKASIDPPLVPFGARFDLVIELVRDRGAPVTLPESIPETEACPRAGEPRTEVEELPLERGADGGVDGGVVIARVRETLRIPYLALDTEKLKTPALVLTTKDGGTLDVPALDVRVQVPHAAEVNAGPDGGVLLGPDGGPLGPGEVPLEPAVGTIAYPVPDERPWVALGTFGIAGLLLALVRFVQRRMTARAPIVVAPAAPPRPAHEVALERLDALLGSGLLQRGETAPFVERLMDEVLRDYIAARFALPAGARTTRELVKELLGVTVMGLDVALVDELLKDADLVKFAKATIPQERAHAMATRVRTLVESTAELPRVDDGGAS